MILLIRNPLKEKYAIVCFQFRCTSYWACSEQRSLELFSALARLSVSAVAMEGHPSPLVMVESYVQHKSFCLQDVMEATLLERFTFPRR